MSGPAKSRLGILLSGRGSNFEAIARNVLSGVLDADIALVFSNRPDAPGLSKAAEFGLKTASLSTVGFDRVQYDARVAEALKEAGVNMVCLAGYMRLLSGAFVSQFSGRILNIHPSLLPAFPGLDAQHQALAHGAKVTGCTVHFVDETLDNGPILLQSAVPIHDDDTVDMLSLRILAEEHRIYTQAIAWVLKGNFRIEGRRVLTT